MNPQLSHWLERKCPGWDAENIIEMLDTFGLTGQVLDQFAEETQCALYDKGDRAYQMAVEEQGERFRQASDEQLQRFRQAEGDIS